jgi:ascorbate-specific PTS system EIIC-type component UlaA
MKEEVMPFKVDHSKYPACWYFIANVFVIGFMVGFAAGLVSLFIALGFHLVLVHL